MNKFANNPIAFLFKNVTNAHTDVVTDRTIKSIDIAQDSFEIKRTFQIETIE